MTTPAVAQGRKNAELDPDALAALEEQRDFLLRSIDDLEAEYAAGDIDEDDYQVLLDDYTARAASVLRALEARRARFASQAPPRRLAVIAAWVACVLVLGVLAGLFVAQSSGRRGEGDTISGEIRETTTQRLIGANELVEAGDIEGAIDMYDEILAEEPANAEALAYQGVLLYGLGDTDRGVDQLLDAIAADPLFIDAWSFLLVTYDQEGRLEDGLADVRTLVEAGDVDVALGIATQLSGSSAIVAVRVYDTVLDVEPDQAEALTYRGWLVHLAGLDDEAIAYLDRAVAAEPGRSDAHAFRVIVLRDLDRIDEARAALVAYDESDPPPEIDALIDQSGIREEITG